MAQRIVVDDLINEIRAMTDEDNRESVSDADDILPALNRAQNYAVDILARQYKEPLLASTSITLVSGVDLYAIPEDALEQRVLTVEVNQSGTFYPVQYIDYQDIGIYENSQTRSSTPYYYTVIGSQLKIVPVSTGANSLRVWYLRDPMPLVAQQGRINLVNSGSNYVILDSAGDDLSSVSDDLESFVNIIDGASGIRKGTMQIQSIVDTKITFKTVPTRTLVLDLEVDTSLAALDTGLVVAQDDYLCLAPGSCVPFLKKPLSNFLVQYAVAEITRKLGGEAGLEEQVLQKFEKQIERTWVQRPNGLRVRKRSANWSMPARRLPRTGV